MANIAKTYTFVNGQPADATQVNKNFDDIIAGVGDISAAGHALIDDADAAAQIATLGAMPASGAWASYTPTLTPNAGVFTSVSCQMYWNQIGKTVTMSFQITLTNIGTASGAIYFALPVVAKRNHAGAVMGSEQALTGYSLIGDIIDTGQTGRLSFYTGASCIVNGYLLVGTAIYEAA